MAEPGQMVIVVVTHEIKPDMEADAARRIDDNGREMAAAPGYLFRYRMSPPDNPRKMVTVTAWRRPADFDHWLEIKKGLPPTPGLSASRLYEGSSREVYLVDAADAGPPAT